MICKLMISKLDTKVRKRDIRAVGAAMKNVTITLDDAIAKRAQDEASRRGQSLSKFVGELIEREIEREKKSGLEAIEEFLSGPLLSEGSGPFTTRQDIYDERIDELVRRYERANLRDR
jgi:predicted transcriptional regulator